MLGAGLYESYAGDIDPVMKQQGDFIDKTKGAIRVAMSKEQLKEGNHHIVRSYGGIYHYDSIAVYGLSHWTPNIYFHALSITEENLRAVRVLGFEMDVKVEPYKIEEAFLQLGLPCRPAVMIDTPRGIQFFIVLDQAFQGSKKAIAAAKALSFSLREKLASVLPLDMNASPIGWFRFPRIDTVLHYRPEHVWDTKEALLWLKDNPFKQGKNRLETKGKWLNTSAAQLLLQSNAPIGERNMRAYALALMCYHDGLEEGNAVNILDEWNSRQNESLPWAELSRTINSAYQGRKGISLDIIERLVGERPDIFKGTWYKWKKERKDRTYSHFNETEEDIYHYIKNETSSDWAWVETTYRKLAKSASREKELKKSAIQKLKQSKFFVVREKIDAHGQALKGRSAGFFIALRTQFLEAMRQESVKFKQSYCKKSMEQLMSKLPLFRYCAGVCPVFFSFPSLLELFGDSG